MALGRPYGGDKIGNRFAQSLVLLRKPRCRRQNLARRLPRGRRGAGDPGYVLRYRLSAGGRLLDVAGRNND